MEVKRNQTTSDLLVYNFQLPFTNMTIDTLHLFRNVVGGDFWQLPLKNDTKDRLDRTESIDRADRTDKTDGTDRTDRTDRDSGPIRIQSRR